MTEKSSQPREDTMMSRSSEELEEGRRRADATAQRLAAREFLRPSAVFAARLRETREARGKVPQAILAQQLTENGVPMGRAALTEIEKGVRRVSIDEALALAAHLNAAPAGLLTPPTGAYVRLSDAYAVDGGGMREFLRFGLFPGAAAVSEEQQQEDELDDFQRTLARLAISLADAVRRDDGAGIKDAGNAIYAAVLEREEQRRREATS
jgi:transcriptional regulator with XRE-family HTH domain